MNPRPRRGVKWVTRILAAACAGAMLFWMFHVPYRPERAARAIPADVLWVSRHEAPAERWAEISRNPVVAQLLDSGLGVVPFERGIPLPDRLAGLLSDRVWLAQSMPDPLSLRRAWYGAAWAGARGRRLRWKIKVFRPPAVERYGTHAGRALYRLHVPELPPPLHLTLAFEEGLVLFCLSEEVQDLRRMLDAYDGRVPSMVDAGRFPPEDAPDAGRIRVGAGSEWSVRIDALDAARTSLRFEAVSALPIGEGTAAPAETPVHAPPWGDAAAVLAYIRPGLLASAPVPATGLWPALAELRSALLPLGDGAPVVIGLFGDPFTGRFRGLRIPGLAAAWRTEAAPEEVDAAVSRALDRLNARYHWGWIPADGPSGRARIRIVTGTRMDALGALPAQEAPAYAVHQGYLWLAANARMLQALIEAAPPPGTPAAYRLPRGDEELLLQAHLEQAAPALRLAFTVHRLFRIAAGGAPAAGDLETHARAKRALDVLSRFGTMEISFRWRGGQPSIRGTILHPEPTRHVPNRSPDRRQ